MNTPQNTSDNPQPDNRKVYETPKLIEYGTIAEMTRGETGQGFDAPAGGPSYPL